jgi:hypothetical protein
MTLKWRGDFVSSFVVATAKRYSFLEKTLTRVMFHFFLHKTLKTDSVHNLMKEDAISNGEHVCSRQFAFASSFLCLLSCSVCRTSSSFILWTQHSVSLAKVSEILFTLFLCTVYKNILEFTFELTSPHNIQSSQDGIHNWGTEFLEFWYLKFYFFKGLIQILTLFFYFSNIEKNSQSWRVGKCFFQVNVLVSWRTVICRS